MGDIYSCTSEGEEALATGVAETVIALIGAANTRAKVVEWGIAFDSTSATAEPVVIRLVQITTDGTATNAAKKTWSQGANVANCTGRHSYTVEPTKDAAPYAVYECHPQAGMIMQYPLGRELQLPADATDGVGIEVTAPAGVNAVAYIVWEE